MEHENAYREYDEMVCPDCGKRWDLNEEPPKGCKEESPD